MHGPLLRPARASRRYRADSYERKQLVKFKVRKNNWDVHHGKKTCAIDGLSRQL